MWFLECEGDLFEHKRIWLRPGSKHVLGRTSKPEDGQRMSYIADSSVSRKHLTIEIDHVQAGASAHLHTKTKLSVSDSSKIGSWANDEKVDKGTTKTLERNDNKIKIGNYAHLFRIKWQPIVFSFPNLSRASRQQADPLADQRSFLEPLGIKCVTEYVTAYTTHLVAKKRNTSSTLQALVNARYIVTDDYLDELRRLTPEALEQDFSAHWPSEEPFSPLPGSEPNPRPHRSPDFLPNPERSDIFSQYTFVFSDPGQHAMLMPVITGGGGKALCHAINPEEPSATDLLEYVREVGGKKADKGFNLSQQPKTKGGIVVVKIGGADEVLPGFYPELDSALGQASVEQNELLEVILDVDASKLKRRAEVVQTTEDTNMENGTESPSVQEPSPAPSQPPTTRRRPSRRPASQRLESVDVDAEAPSATPDEQPSVLTTKRRGRRPLTQTKFKGFDEIDMNQLPKYRSPSPSQHLDNEPSQEPLADGMHDMEHPPRSQPPASQPSQRSSRKRPAPPEEQETYTDVMNNMLKGAAAMKKRRIAEGRDANKSPEDSAVAEQDPTPAPAVKKPKIRKDKEIDVKAMIQEARQKEEEQRLVDEENLREALEGMDVGEIRNLAQIEEMEIVRREPPPRSRYNPMAGHDDRWDDRWNGRKNFKRFRRQGNPGHTQNRPRVFVPLEEVAANSFASNDEDYFLERPSSNKSKRSQQKASQQRDRDGDIEIAATPGTVKDTQQRSTNSINLVSSDADSGPEEDSGTQFRRRIYASRLQDAENSRADELFPEEIAGTARDKNIADAARQAKSSANSRTQPGKRTAAGVVDKESGARKRQTKIRQPSPDEVSESEDEENSTRFRRRKN